MKNLILLFTISCILFACNQNDPLVDLKSEGRQEAGLEDINSDEVKSKAAFENLSQYAKPVYVYTKLDFTDYYYSLEKKNQISVQGSVYYYLESVFKVLPTAKPTGSYPGLPIYIYYSPEAKRHRLSSEDFDRFPQGPTYFFQQGILGYSVPSEHVYYHFETDKHIQLCEYYQQINKTYRASTQFLENINQPDRWIYYNRLPYVYW